MDPELVTTTSERDTARQELASLRGAVETYLQARARIDSPGSLEHHHEAPAVYRAYYAALRELERWTRRP